MWLLVLDRNDIEMTFGSIFLNKIWSKGRLKGWDGLY